MKSSSNADSQHLNRELPIIEENRNIDDKISEECIVKLRFNSSDKSNEKVKNTQEFNQHSINMEEKNMNNLQNMDCLNAQKIGNSLQNFLSIPIVNDSNNDLNQVPSVQNNLNILSSYPPNYLNNNQIENSKNFTIPSQDLQKISQNTVLFPGIPGFLCNFGNYYSFIPQYYFQENNQNQLNMDFENQEGPNEVAQNSNFHLNPQGYFQNLIMNRQEISPNEVNQIPFSNTIAVKSPQIIEDVKRSHPLNFLEEKEMLSKLTPQEIRKYKIEKFRQKKIRLGWISGKKKGKNEVVGRKYRVNGKFVRRSKALELINIPLNEVASNKLVNKIIKSKSDYALSATVEVVTFYNFDNLIHDAFQSVALIPDEKDSIEVRLLKIDHHRKTIQISIDRKKQDLKPLTIDKPNDTDSNSSYLNYIIPKPYYQVFRNNLKKVPMIHFEQHLTLNSEEK